MLNFLPGFVVLCDTMNRKFLFLFLLFIATMGFGQSAEYALATDHYNKSRYAEALAVLSDVEGSSAYNFDILLLKANCLQKEEKFVEAESTYRSAEKINSESAILYANWSAALYNLKQYENADKKARKALKLDPNLAEANYFMGNVKYQNFSLSAALRYYNKAVKLKPAYRDALYMRAATQAELKNYSQALRDYQKVLEIDPDLEIARYNIAVVELASGSYTAAKEAFAKLNPEVLPKAVDFYYYQAEALWFDGSKEEACEIYKKAADLGDVESREIYEKYCVGKQQREPELKTRTIRATF